MIYHVDGYTFCSMAINGLVFMVSVGFNAAARSVSHVIKEQASVWCFNYKLKFSFQFYLILKKIIKIVTNFLKSN